MPILLDSWLIYHDRLLNNDEYSDMKIFIGETEIPAHSSVLCLQSETFKNGFKHKVDQAKQFRFKTGSGNAHWRVLQYMYTGDYSDETCQELQVDGKYA